MRGHLAWTILVGVRGFEPPAPASRTQCSTRLSYTPTEGARIAPVRRSGKALNTSGRGLWCRAAVGGLGPSVVPRLHQLQHRGRRLLDRASRHIDRRPPMAVAEP